METFILSECSNAIQISFFKFVCSSAAVVCSGDIVAVAVWESSSCHIFEGHCGCYWGPVAITILIAILCLYFLDLQNKNSYFVRIIILSSTILVFLLLPIAYYLINRGKKSKSLNKVDKLEKGVTTPLTKSTRNCHGTPGTEQKTRKGPTLEKNKGNIQQNNADSKYSPIGTEENILGTPGTEIKERKGSTVKKEKENASVTNNKDTGKTPTSEKKQKNSSQPEAKKKSVKKNYLLNN
ncbi:unnamed protein product [Ranitomeya imitator]|uniref:Uncharacterized protein n=1 Tax=Ranitomeya imitator TaxID=111125 RepID=A0ABN9M9R0_9NEOB|nr:unnamed protein product [Ranitomeya imitator]